jgi:hypothetical protein
MKSALCRLNDARRDHFSLAEILFHIKDASLETVCVAAMREMEMGKLSWDILENHMQNSTFSTFRALPYQAHGGMPVTTLKRVLGVSWMFNESINPSVL